MKKIIMAFGALAIAGAVPALAQNATTPPPAPPAPDAAMAPPAAPTPPVATGGADAAGAAAAGAAIGARPFTMMGRSPGRK